MADSDSQLGLEDSKRLQWCSMPLETGGGGEIKGLLQGRLMSWGLAQWNSRKEVYNSLVWLQNVTYEKLLSYLLRTGV